jgi:epoxyqueuosine reductase QueG
MSEKSASADLTQAVKALAKEHGAILVGVAPIERFDPQPPYYDRAPKGHDPRDFVPDAKSVISFAMPIMSPVVDAPAALLDQMVEWVPPDVKQAYMVNPPVRGDCARVCPVAQGERRLPKRLQSLIERQAKR